MATYRINNVLGDATASGGFYDTLTNAISAVKTTGTDTDPNFILATDQTHLCPQGSFNQFDNSGGDWAFMSGSLTIGADGSGERPRIMGVNKYTGTWTAVGNGEYVANDENGQFTGLGANAQVQVLIGDTRIAGTFDWNDSQTNWRPLRLGTLITRSFFWDTTAAANPYGKTGQLYVKPDSIDDLDNVWFGFGNRAPLRFEDIAAPITCNDLVVIGSTNMAGISFDNCDQWTADNIHAKSNHKGIDVIKCDTSWTISNCVAEDNCWRGLGTSSPDSANPELNGTIHDVIVRRTGRLITDIGDCESIMFGPGGTGCKLYNFVIEDNGNPAYDGMTFQGETLSITSGASRLHSAAVEIDDAEVEIYNGEIKRHAGKGIRHAAHTLSGPGRTSSVHDVLLEEVGSYDFGDGYNKYGNATFNSPLGVYISTTDSYITVTYERITIKDCACKNSLSTEGDGLLSFNARNGAQIAATIKNIALIGTNQTESLLHIDERHAIGAGASNTLDSTVTLTANNIAFCGTDSNLERGAVTVRRAGGALTSWDMAKVLDTGAGSWENDDAADITVANNLISTSPESQLSGDVPTVDSDLYEAGVNSWSNEGRPKGQNNEPFADTPDIGCNQSRHNANHPYNFTKV